MVAVSNGSSRPHRPLQPVCQTAAFSAPPRSVDGGHVDLSHRHHRGEGAARLVAAGGERLGQRARDDLPVYAPAVLAPPAFALAPAVADDRVPVPIGLLLRVGRDLEREGFSVRKRRPAVQPDAGDAADGELDHQHIAGLAGRVVGRGAVHGRHFAVGKDRSIEARGFLGLAVVPEANGVLWDVCHVATPSSEISDSRGVKTSAGGPGASFALSEIGGGPKNTYAWIATMNRPNTAVRTCWTHAHSHG